MSQAESVRVVTVTVAILAFLAAVLSTAAQARQFAPQAQTDVATTWAGDPGGPASIAPEVPEAIGATQADDMITVIVALKQQPNLEEFSGMDRPARIRGVVRRLQSTANLTQRGIRALLADRRAEGRVGRVFYFWVFNGLAVTATPDVIQELAAWPEVLSITPNETIHAPPLPSGQALAALPGTEPNLSVINAPEL